MTNYGIRGLVVSQCGTLFKLVGGFRSVHHTDQKYLVVGVFSKDLAPRGTGPSVSLLPTGYDHWHYIYLPIPVYLIISYWYLNVYRT